MTEPHCPLCALAEAIVQHARRRTLPTPEELAEWASAIERADAEVERREARLN
jgi:hypothetical protein